MSPRASIVGQDRRRPRDADIANRQRPGEFEQFTASLAVREPAFARNDANCPASDVCASTAVQWAKASSRHLALVVDLLSWQMAELAVGRAGTPASGNGVRWCRRRTDKNGYGQSSYTSRRAGTGVPSGALRALRAVSRRNHARCVSAFESEARRVVATRASVLDEGTVSPACFFCCFIVSLPSACAAASSCFPSGADGTRFAPLNRRDYGVPSL